MDLQCPAVVVCLTPEEEIPEAAGGYRVVGAYRYGAARPRRTGSLRCDRAPEGKFWEVITKVADLHRGEAVVLYARAEDLDPRDLRGVVLSVDSHGPQRIVPAHPVDNGY